MERCLGLLEMVPQCDALWVGYVIAFIFFFFHCPLSFRPCLSPFFTLTFFMGFFPVADTHWFVSPIFLSPGGNPNTPLPNTEPESNQTFMHRYKFIKILNQTLIKLLCTGTKILNQNLIKLAKILPNIEWESNQTSMYRYQFTRYRGIRWVLNITLGIQSEKKKTFLE